MSTRPESYRYNLAVHLPILPFTVIFWGGKDRKQIVLASKDGAPAMLDHSLQSVTNLFFIYLFILTFGPTAQVGFLEVHGGGEARVFIVLYIIFFLS